MTSLSRLAAIRENAALNEADALASGTEWSECEECYDGITEQGSVCHNCDGQGGFEREVELEDEQ